MNGLVYSASLMAAFLGGALALFAPCCIVTLLPAFVGASLRRGIRSLATTALLFSAGLATILLPIVTGIGALGQAIGRYHVAVFVIVGAFLMLLGAYILTGKRWSLPMPMMNRLRYRSPNGEGSTFFLGVASGVASSCCAPVMAGVVALSALSGTWAGALGLGVAYVFGMVFPLLLFAIVAARRGEGRRSAPRRVHLFGNALLWTDAISGSMFVLFGASTVVLGLSGEASVTPGPLAAWDRWITAKVAGVAIFLGSMPVALQAALLIALASAVAIPLRRAVKRSHGESEDAGRAANRRTRVEDERDPVCLMTVTATDLTATWNGTTYRFCSVACCDDFLASPDRYAAQPSSMRS